MTPVDDCLQSLQSSSQDNRSMAACPASGVLSYILDVVVRHLGLLPGNPNLQTAQELAIATRDKVGDDGGLHRLGSWLGGAGHTCCLTMHDHEAHTAVPALV
jgi:hypothetical protein